MMLDYSIKTADGQDSTMPVEEIQKQLQSNGYQNAVIKPDGNGVEYTINGQVYDDNVPDLLKMLGHEVTSIVPRNAEESFVQPAWRAALETLPDDEGVRKAYIKSKLKESGHVASDDQIMGSGSDWYFMNPDTGKWYATTNAKGFDVADLAGYAAQAPGFLGSVAGGALGAGAGVGLGSIPLGAAGAVAGDFTGRSTAQGISAAFDPSVREALGNNGLGQTALSNLKTAAPSAIGGALGGIPGVSQALSKGFATRVAQPMAEGLGALGNVVKRGAGYAAESPVIKGITTGLIPGLNTAQMAGFGLRAGEIPVAVNKGLGWLGKKGADLAESAIAKGGLNAEEGAFLQNIADKGSQMQFNSEARIFAPGVENKGFIERGIKKIFKPAEDAQSAFGKQEVKGFYENVGKRMGRPRDAYAREALKRAENMSPEKANRFLEMAQGRMSTINPTALGKSIGKAAQTASTAGRTLENASEGVVGLGFRGIQGMGAATELGGKVLAGGARIAQPAEGRMLLQGASDAAYNYGRPTIADMMKEKKKQGIFNK
jgi:hypothetical protein